MTCKLRLLILLTCIPSARAQDCCGIPLQIESRYQAFGWAWSCSASSYCVMPLIAGTLRSILTTILSVGPSALLWPDADSWGGRKNHLRFLLLLLSGHYAAPDLCDCLDCSISSPTLHYLLKYLPALLRLPCPLEELVMLSDHLLLCHPPLCLKSFPASDGTKSQRSQASEGSRDRFRFKD